MDDLEGKLFKREWDHLADPRHLLHAVIDAYEQAEAAGMKPGGEIWSTNRPYFISHARQPIVDRWSELSQFEPEQFPWTDDMLVYTWISWRKAMAPAIARAKANLGIGETLFAPGSE